MFTLRPTEHYSVLEIQYSKRIIGFMPETVLGAFTYQNTSEATYYGRMESLCAELKQIRQDRDWYRDKCQYLETKLKQLEDKLNAR